MNIYAAIDKVKRLLEKRVVFTIAQRNELNESISQLFQEYINANAIMMYSNY